MIDCKYVEQMHDLELEIMDLNLSDAVTAILNYKVQELVRESFSAGHDTGYKLGKDVYGRSA